MPIVLFSAFSFVAGCSQNTGTGGSDAGSGGGPAKAPSALQGLAYTPEPSDYGTNHGQGQTYYDSDFANDDFTALWGDYTDPQSGQSIGRKDLANLSTNLKVNLIRLYDWYPPPSRNHIPFLDECQRDGIKVIVPISNYFVGLVQAQDPSAPMLIKALAGEVYQTGQTGQTGQPHPAAAMFSISNEYELSQGAITADGIAKTAALLLQAEAQLGVADEARLPITSPVSFAVEPPSPDPAISAIRGLAAAFSNAGLTDVFTARFIAGINVYSPGSADATYVLTTFPNDFGMMPSSLLFTEIGQNSDSTNGGESGQATYVMGQLSALEPLWRDPQKTLNGYFLGACVFQFLDQTFKGGAEAEYGIYKFSGSTLGMAKTRSGQSYPVDKLTAKAVVGTLQAAFSM